VPVQLDNYIDVAARHRMALEKHPDLRVIEGPVEVVTVDGQTHIAVTMTVYRDPDDPLPCTATAWEPFPGKTPYTRGSEMMNASTSALGRALGLMGFGIGKSIASRDEVANRQEPDRPTDTPRKPSEPRKPSPSTDGTKAPKLANQPQMAKINILLMGLGIVDRPAKLAKVIDIIGRPVESSTDLTVAEASTVIDRLQIEADSKAELDRLANLEVPG
jgi:hypothetical protein